MTKAKPTGDLVPSDGQAAEVRRRFDDQGKSDEYEYRGGRQSTGAVPDPDDRDDAESAVSFGGAAELDNEEDMEQDGETDTELDFEIDLQLDSEPDSTDDTDEDQIVNAQPNEDLNGTLQNPK